MRRQPAPRGVEKRINRLALRRHAIAHAELLDLGLSPSAIARRVRSGRLVQLHRGVYAIGGAPSTRLQTWAGAVLACGPGAALSHFSAAVLLRLRKRNPAVVDVSVLTRSRRGHDGIRVHRPRRLLPEDVIERNGVRVTSVPRTLLDCAGGVSSRTIERMLDEAEYLGILELPDVNDLLGRTPGSPGNRPLARVLTKHAPGTTRTRSTLEEAFLALVRRSNLPEPEVNARLGPFEVDFLWRREGVAVETDGRRAHERTAARERDYRRDAWLHANGFRPLRFTWSQVVNRPDEVIAALTVALNPRGAT